MTRHHDIQGKPRHFGGWQRDHHDSRDLKLVVHVKDTLPVAGSVRDTFAPPIRDQSSLGSCTANAGVEAAGFVINAETKQGDPMFSRLDLYAITRTIEGTPLSEDSGCQVRDVFKAMAQYGVAAESEWPYDITKFDELPPRTVMTDALQHKALSYHRCDGLDAIKTSIVQGFPVIGGFVCFESLQSDAVAATGDVPLLKPDEQQIGGHCIYFDGFDDVRGVLLFRNSWGPEWGDGGCGTLPYGYVEQGLASDFWTARKIATGTATLDDRFDKTS